MGASKRICPNCGRKMKQQRKKVGNKVKQLPTIHHK